MSKHDEARRAFLIGAAVGAGAVAGRARARGGRPDARAAPGERLPATTAQSHAQGSGHGAFLNDDDAATVAAFAERLMPGAPGKPGAREAGVLNYIDLALSGAYEDFQDFYRRGLASDWHRLDERIEGLSSEIEELAKRDAGCERLMSIPGIGPIISSAMVAAIGTGDNFSKGRDFAAWLGLVPRQISTGDRTILGKISKRGHPLPARPVRAGSMGRSCKSETDQIGRPWAQALDSRPPGSGCITTCSPSPSPTSSRASHGAFLLTVEPSRRTNFRLLRDRSRPRPTCTADAAR